MKLILPFVCLTLTSAFAMTMSSNQHQPKALIKGQIYDSQFGLPVPNAKVTIVSADQLHLSDVSDRQGRYEIRNVTEGPHTIVVDSLGYARGEQSIKVAKDEEVIIDIPLKVGLLHDPSEFTVNGSVKLGNGRPASDVSVVIVNPFEHQVLATTRTNKSGQFTLQAALPGQYVVYMFKSGFRVHVASIIVRPAVQPHSPTLEVVLFPLRL